VQNKRDNETIKQKLEELDFTVHRASGKPESQGEIVKKLLEIVIKFH
jgi:hypothetical protein